MRNHRIFVFVNVLVLIAIGIVMIYSASSIPMWQQEGQSSLLLKKQLLYVFFGFLLMFACMIFDYRLLQRYAKPIFLISLIPLVLLLVPGFSKEVGGAKRWLRFFGFSYQPSEFMKLTLTVYLADFVTRKKQILREFWRGFLPPFMVVVLTALLVVLEPDLGTAISLVVLGLVILFVAGTKVSFLGSSVMAAFPLLYFLLFRVPYRRARIAAFLNPWLDPKGSGFQIIQSQIALGSGGFWGVGLGQGRQKLFYLPAAHTDFIFSVIGEELGFLGAAAVIVLFFLLIWKIFRIVLSVRDPFGKVLSAGILTFISFSAVVNIGVSLGCLPTKGLPLPFVSYGGSALVFHMAAIGLLLNISKTEELPV